MTGISREIYMDGRAEGIAEGKAEGKAEGIAEGKAEGIAEGFAKMKELLVELYNKNMVTKEYAAEKLSMTEDEFLKLVK